MIVLCLRLSRSLCFCRETMIMPNFTQLGIPGDQGADRVLSVHLMSVFTESLLYVRDYVKPGKQKMNEMPLLSRRAWFRAGIKYHLE